MCERLCSLQKLLAVSVLSAHNPGFQPRKRRFRKLQLPWGKLLVILIGACQKVVSDLGLGCFYQGTSSTSSSWLAMIYAL